MHLFSYNIVSAAEAEKAKSEYSNFILNIVKVNKSSFAGFNKSKQHLDVFMAICRI